MMSNQPQHQQFALQDPQPRAYKMDLQLPPPPRNSTPSFTSKNLPQQPPNSKSQDDWLRDCGHPSLQSFLEYYGFDPRDADDIAEGRDFLSLIRRQEQEQYEERQSQPQPQSQPTRKGIVNNPSLVRRTTNDSFSGGTTPPTQNNVLSRSGTPSMRNEVLTRNTTPTMNIYGLRPFEMEEAERMGRVNATMQRPSSSSAQQQQQIPRSTEGRFHNRVVSETVMNAYGIKPWEVEAAEGLRANLGSYGR